MKSKKYILFSLLLSFVIFQGCKFEHINDPYTDESTELPVLTNFIFMGKVVEVGNTNTDMSGCTVKYTGQEHTNEITISSGNEFSFTSDKPFTGEYTIEITKDGFIQSTKKINYDNAEKMPVIAINFSLKKKATPQPVSNNSPIEQTIEFDSADEGDINVSITIPPNVTIIKPDGTEGNVELSITTLSSDYISAEKTIPAPEGKVSAKLLTIDMGPKETYFSEPINIVIDAPAHFANNPNDVESLLANMSIAFNNEDIWEDSPLPINYNAETNKLSFAVSGFGNNEDIWEDKKSKKNINRAGGGNQAIIWSDIEATVVPSTEGIIVHVFKPKSNCGAASAPINVDWSLPITVPAGNTSIDDATAFISNLYETTTGVINPEAVYNTLTKESIDGNLISEYKIFYNDAISYSNRDNFKNIVTANVQNTIFWENGNNTQDIGFPYDQLTSIEHCDAYVLYCYYKVERIKITSIESTYSELTGTYTRYISPAMIGLVEIPCGTDTDCHQSGGSGSGK